MTIETKYNIGDEVWTIGYENGTFEIVKCRIASIEIKKNSSISIIRYKLQVIKGDNNDALLAEYYLQDMYLEEKLFPTSSSFSKKISWFPFIISQHAEVH